VIVSLAWNSFEFVYCVKETARVIDGPKKGPGAGRAGSLGTQKAQNGEVLKASQKAKAMCKSRHPVPSWGYRDEG
jgi:hypothetical protein